MEMNDYSKPMGGMSAYEQVKTAYMASKRPSGVGITGLVLGASGLLLGIGAWIFGPTYAKSQADRARDVANARYDANQNQLSLLTSLLAAERTERVAQGVTMSQSITDTISGQQQGSQSQTQSQTTAIDNTMQQIMQQTLADAITGRSSLNPTPVNIYSAPQPCGCPGCGCNG